MFKTIEKLKKSGSQAILEENKNINEFIILKIKNTEYSDKSKLP